MSKMVFVAAKRTPFGAFNGSFQKLTANDLATLAANAALDSCPNSRDFVDHVILGNVAQTSQDAAYLARHVGLRAGISQSVPAVTVNRLCGSGFESIVQAGHLIQLGLARAVLVGGTENMTQAPYVLRGARAGIRMGNTELEDSLTSSLTDSFIKMPMAITAENLATQFGISRQACDEFALASQNKTEAAYNNGFFKDELIAVEAGNAKKPNLVSKDEHPRSGSTIEHLKKLKPVFKPDGVITAGNASGITDGAACLLVCREEIAKQQNWQIMGTFVSSAVVGCDPSIMGIGPVSAVRKALALSNLKLTDMKSVEINEAFAAQVLAVMKELSLSEKNVNCDGGAIAIGHPLAASGARIITHQLYQLKRLGGGYGIGSACIGGGQGIAVVIETSA